MAILVLNSGGSSLKFRLYTAGAGSRLHERVRGTVAGFGADAAWRWEDEGRVHRGRAPIHDQRAAAHWLLARLAQDGTAAIEAVGHRVVHGDDAFTRPVRLTPDVIARLDALSPLAPLHNPPALDVIHACAEALGERVPMVAVFDTAFHASLPGPARHYALPRSWVRACGIRRFGFHGLAHRSMYERYLAVCGTASSRPRVVAFQLGHGCSATAIDNGASVETSMGYTPLEGLIMATRSGDVDPGALAALARAGIGPSELEAGLNHESGLLALTGDSGDMRELLARADDRARRAIDAFCHRARKYLGAYLAVLGGADAVLFGGGIGEHAPQIRARICADLQWCGLRLDARANEAAAGAEARVSAPDSAIAVHVLRVDEEILIARDTRAVIGS